MFRLACLCFLSITLSSFAAPQDPVSAESERREKFKSILLEYRQSNRQINDKTATKPEHEITIVANNKLVLKGAKSRFEDNNPLMSPGLFRQKRIEVFDGEIFRVLLPEGVAPGDGPVGAINRDVAQESFPQLLAMFLLGNKRTSELKASGKTEMIDASLCLEYVRETNNSVERHWFDSAKGFIPVRVQRETNGQVTFRETIAYRADDTWSWLPTGWKSEWNRNGKLWYSKQIEITKLEVNGSIPEDTFQLVFGPGTSVHDQLINKQMFVEADGSIREVTMEEINGSRLGIKKPSWWSRNAWYLVIVGCGAIFAFLCLDLIRRHRTSTLKCA